MRYFAAQVLQSAPHHCDKRYGMVCIMGYFAAQVGLVDVRLARRGPDRDRVRGVEDGLSLSPRVLLVLAPDLVVGTLAPPPLLDRQLVLPRLLERDMRQDDGAPITVVD
jgi:hypothetical protein